MLVSSLSVWPTSTITRSCPSSVKRLSGTVTAVRPAGGAGAERGGPAAPARSRRRRSGERRGRAPRPRQAGGPHRRAGRPSAESAPHLFTSARTVEWHVRKVFDRPGTDEEL